MFFSIESSLMGYLFELHGDYPALDIFFIAVANYSTHFFVVVFLMVAASLFYYKFKLNKQVWLSSLLILPGVLLANYLLRVTVNRNRPFTLEEEFSSLLYHYYHNSFPSNHAAASFAVAGIVYLLSPRWGKLLFVLAALVSISRVYTGLHFPSDVLAGAMLSLAFLFLFCRYRESLLQIYKKTIGKSY